MSGSFKTRSGRRLCDSESTLRPWERATLDRARRFYEGIGWKRVRQATRGRPQPPRPSAPGEPATTGLARGGGRRALAIRDELVSFHQLAQALRRTLGN
jgi:hypothetical protein